MTMVTAVLERLRRLPPMVPDGAVAVVLMVSAGLAEFQDAGKLTLVQVLAIALITLPLTERRLFPSAVSATIGAALIVHLLLGFTNSFVENFAILLALYTVYASARSGWRIAVMSGILVIGLTTGVILGWRDQHHVYLSDIGYNAIIFALPVILGYGVRTRRAYVAQLHEQSKLLARQAAADERTAIARELHDVIAHSLSVMVLQATAGRRLARRDPANAAAAFEVIEQTGRDALSDMRRAIGVLKTDSVEAASLAPQPSLRQLDALVDQVRKAGVSVRVSIDGTQRPLAPGVELSAYRIVQESLTNMLRHSGADGAVVAIRYGIEDLTVEVTDNGRKGTMPPADGGGLTGMRERVALLHGDFRAGSTVDGFTVSARLPLEPRTA
ncbi:MAG TPA: sensor histidine kinase [Candidatus Dormibacteraeota bacterium]|jgi:signal transduction histidine kinase|nr:sensor histidine kinase [Candidatus Dormibacteraeota bacterium]